MIYSSGGIIISGGIVVLFLLWHRYNRKPKFVVPKKNLNNRAKINRGIIYSTMFLLVLLPLNIQYRTEQKIVSDKQYSIQILLDVSLSMAAKDLDPSRFSAAKDALQKLAQGLEGYPFSLVGFSGVPLITIPFSTDTTGIILRLQNLSLNDFPAVESFVGTAMGDALLLGLKNLLDRQKISETQKGLMILITDGDNNLGYDPKEILEIIKPYEIPVLVIGIGYEKYLIGYDKSFVPIKTDFNEKLLIEIAKISKGEYFRITQTEDFQKLFEQVIESIKSQEKQYVENVYFPINIILILMYLLGVLYYMKEWFHILLIRKNQGSSI